MFSSRKRRYAPGIEQINQLVKTSANKEKTDLIRFIVTATIAAIAAIAATVAAVATIMSRRKK